MRPTEAVRAFAIACAPLLALGCRGTQSALDPKGPYAQELYDLYVVMLIGGAAVFAFVMLALVVSLVVKGKPREPRQRVGVAVAVALTVTLLIALLVDNMFVSRVLTAQQPNAVPIEVTAHQWWWEVTYPGDPANLTVRTANELHIPVGRPVRVKLESRDVVHSFWVPNLHGKIDAIPGMINDLTIQADVAGVYRGQCAEFCGLQHALMAFVVVAEPEPDFQAWLRAQSESAVEPTDELAAWGQEVFLTQTCPTCHAIRGTQAMAAVGPDLTHLASRRTLAAGTLENGRGQLAGWILDPQHVKPGNFMPRNDIDAESLQALIHYLESLR